ncbi:tetratricopeptide repeat protein [Cellvibrio sp. pealriver]|uniref:YfgM family protein n=1 Tax=Cellvibrio sp. pealriver TaxID=1622269 RepID=UPI00066FD77E|nr:tetratricopeptide repeat protein [Cellvibrio sp. pealriver]
MSVHLSEEEQLEVLKRWWKDYGKTVVIAVVVAVVGYFGYTTWQDQKRQKAEQASEMYEQLLKLAVTEPGKSLSASDKATISHLAGELKDANNKSMYAHSAAFFLAKLAVEDNRLDDAVTELKWVLSAKPDAATEQLARLRLARVLTAQKAYDDALAQLSPEPAAAFTAEYAEARGDILKLQGDLDAARTAYEKALTAANPQQQERYMLLQMKVNDLKVDATVPAAAAAEEKAQ